MALINTPSRHSSYDPVRLEPSRLQWYDSNTRRALLPQPPSTTQRTVSWLTVEELNKLPLSTYRTRQQAQATCSGDNSQDSPEHLGASSSSNGVNLTPTHVAESRSENGPGQSPSSYLVPFSRANNLVPIQPLISSPSSGSPECEVCLGEYRDRDRLRHLPCGHAFHADCIDKWFKQSTTCPKCRAGVKGGIKRLERARANNLLRLSSVGRPSHCERGCLHTLGRGNTSRQLTRPTVAAPVPVIRQERRQSSESRAAEVRRKAGEAAIQRAEAARLSETND